MPPKKKAKPAKKVAAPKKKAAPKKPVKRVAAKPKRVAAKPKRAAAKRAPARKTTKADPEAVLAHLRILCSAHPGLVLEGDDRETFAGECPALEPFMDAAGIDPELLVYSTWAYRKMGRFEEAIAAGARAVEVERTWKSLTAKASAHRAAEQCDLALSLFDEAARLDPDDTSALMEGARTLGEAGRFGEAATWFGRVVEREPDDTDALVWREYAAYCHTKDEAHVAEVQRVLAEDPDHKLARRLLADMTG